LKTLSFGFFVFVAVLLFCCSSSEDDEPTIEPVAGDFYFGADLSYVNQILDHGGQYKDGTETNPYRIFANNGTNLVRLRLWHNPVWTKEVYGEAGTQFYNDIHDVEKSISAARTAGMKVLLDFHYSDTWADPGKQHIPAAWAEIKDVEVLKDSVYKYTRKTLLYLAGKNLLPEFVQLGNETNCGTLFTDAPEGFPTANVCNGQWAAMGKILNAGITAVREVTSTSTIKTKIILHVADPKNVEWWFDNIKSQGLVTDFDMVGFSYYPLWHTTVPVDQISDKVSGFKSRYSKDVIILEAAYPWTTDADDSYNNSFGSEIALPGFPKTKQGQLDLMVKLTQEVKDGKGIGVVYWEPAWISSGLKDLWGTGSSWENCTFFDFEGNRHIGIEYMKHNYK
jgi:arabinogalactan endo-1,4-beta-galactosidase